jgi:hypothetical protein
VRRDLNQPFRLDLRHLWQPCAFGQDKEANSAQLLLVLCAGHAQQVGRPSSMQRLATCTYSADDGYYRPILTVISSALLGGSAAPQLLKDWGLSLIHKCKVLKQFHIARSPCA